MRPASEASHQSGVQLLEDDDFVWGRVWPLVSSGESRPPGIGVEVTIHRHREDGRAVAEYDFGGSVRAFAKAYPDHAEGRTVHGIHNELCKNGFGPTSANCVPEPFGYLDTHGVLVLQPAPGERLGAMLSRDWSAFVEGVVRSARWLGALHTSPLELGPREEASDGFSRLARRAEKAISVRPDLEEIVTQALDELAGRHGSAAGSSDPVQTHGRYHAAHVFVAPESITAVDVDRAALADPAKDVGEFVAGLSSIRTLGVVEESSVDALCEGFVDQYIRHGPGVPHELAYYWSYCIVWALVRRAFKDRPERRSWRRRLDYLRSELDAASRRSAAWLR